ncbi:MAG: hypothetical protein LUD22_04295 [Coprobacillus sp.]|nr:hypothetical protein [Coprobacillus sp.]
MKHVVVLVGLLALVACSAPVENEPNENETEVENKVDYSFFDENIIGTWYIHSAMMGVLSINETFTVNSDYTLDIENIRCLYKGIYAGFEETNLFISESGITTFIVSFDGEDVDWAFSDTAGYYDYGYASSTPLSTERVYDYTGPDWPMEQINSYLNLEGEVPAIESETYYLFNNESSLYRGHPASEVEIFDGKEDTLSNYLTSLEAEGWTITFDGAQFYKCYDTDKIYALRIVEYDGGNICVFIYEYETVFSED